MHTMTLDQKFPCIDDMASAAARRIPHFAWEYLRGGIGREVGLQRNRQALDRVLLEPCYLTKEPANRPELGTTLLGQHFDMPFGVSPVGLSGLMWPGAVEILARAAVAANAPMVLSHFATTHMSDFRTIAGRNGWFQLYSFSKPDALKAVIEDVAATGFETLVVTIDIPTATRRDRELRVGLSVPPKINLNTLWQVATHPRWALATAMTGIPRFRNLKPYAPNGLSMAKEAEYLTELVEGHVTTEVLSRIRAQWTGKLVVKGVMTAEDARIALDCGADGIWVSNHGGRQLDAAWSTVEVLPAIRAALGPDVPIMIDSGPRTGLDIARMLASGADFVFLGRAFIFAVAAIGARGGDHAFALLREELRCTLAQLGCRSVRDLPDFLTKTPVPGEAARCGLTP
ncbi:L-lactate dehydrogenase (cytochrome) [Pseudaminobacter salicylatoxidans]|uniref:L-lactate dehydrogenase (Cytochrome) n=2 Tax=Pseudaminobacter salicylatoxidans TaxID=93369 RepID=A0A316C8R9_PSESE|nr:L-lactate dehydrogenase (cytochrome) [Pseudaminobacter salicylatoxidans]